MHEIFTQVLTHKDLPKAGDLFNVPDSTIVNDLTDVINRIRDIASLPDYTRNDNDQSVVEICITRVTSAIRETESIEQHGEALVALLQTCLNHNLRPTPRGQDPPHAKIASDVLSCIFLNYNKRVVMALALPVAVKFLHKGNKELSRNMSSYLSLAAIEAADLLALHVQPIIDSVISGNYTLSRVLLQIYAVKKDPIHDHVMTLVSLLPQCDINEKLGLLTLFSLVAKNRYTLLEPSLPQLVDGLSASGTSLATLQIFVELCSWRPAPFTEHIAKLKTVAEQHPHCLPLSLQIMACVGRLSKERAKSSLDYIAQQIHKVDSNSLGAILREVQHLCSQYPALLTDNLLAAVNKISDRTNVSAREYIQQLNNEYNEIRNTNVNHTPGGVTIVRVGGGVGRSDGVTSSRSELSLGHRDLGLFQQNTGAGTASKFGNKYQKHSDTSRSTGRLVTASNRSMPKLNALPHSAGRLGSSSIQLNKSMTRLNSAHGLPMNRSITVLSQPTRHLSGQIIQPSSVMGSYLGGSQLSGSRLIGQGVPFPPLLPTSASTVAATSSCAISSLPGTISPSKSTSSIGTLRETQEPYNSAGNSLTMRYSGPLHQIPDIPPPLNTQASHALTTNVTHSLSLPPHMSARDLANSPPNLVGIGLPLQPPNIQVPVTSASATIPSSQQASIQTIAGGTLPMISAKSLRLNTTCTQITSDSVTNSAAATQRISVFEPYAMRDTVQHFCEKHLDKIKGYMQKIFVKLPMPVRCGIEERKNRKHAKLYFACQGKGKHCLYNKHFFSMKTRNPRIWIHLMFLALQARSSVALSTREPQVSSLKNCWDTLKCDNKTFITLVTSAFPSAKDMDLLMHELRHERFFDVFEYNGVEQQWGCFLCNHPDRAQGFLEEDTPVIEGQLKEKKSKWKIFRKWRTRYFTLSGAQLSYRGEEDRIDDKGDIEVQQIRSVKVSKGRQIPKAFEVFTESNSFVLKAKDSSNAEEWVRCLSIVLAQSQAKENSSHQSPSRMATTTIPRNFTYGQHITPSSTFSSNLMMGSRIHV